MICEVAEGGDSRQSTFPRWSWIGDKLLGYLVEALSSLSSREGFAGFLCFFVGFVYREEGEKVDEARVILIPKVV